MKIPHFISSLKPTRSRPNRVRPLWECLCDLTMLQWAQFLSGWLAWTCDATDFFCVSLSVTNLEAQFNRTAHDITTAITLTLLLRSVGAVVFGIISDRYGRKWPLVIVLLLCAIFQLGSGFIQTFRQFLFVRSLFGVAMGGVWGLAAATALENLPVELRGLGSGLIQQGYSAGCMVATVINLNLVVPGNAAGWRSLFWCASGISFLAAFIRSLIPESAIFLRVKDIERERRIIATKKTNIFLRELKTMLARHWLLCIYAAFLMAGFNFLSHGTEDLYPTFLESSKNFSSENTAIATIIGFCGALVGSSTSGLISQYIGRRLTILIFICMAGGFIPLWVLPSSFGALAAGAFCIQFGVQGAWGVIPIHLAEMSPPAFRATFPGVSYQIGNMVASASAQLITIGGENRKTFIYKNGERTEVPDYATVQAMFIGVVSVFVFIITIIGHENHSAHFENAKMGFEEGAGMDEFEMSQESIKNDDEQGDIGGFPSNI